MEENTAEKSRKERRKEARLAKNKKKFDSWVNHQQSTKSRNSNLDSKPVIEENVENEVSADEKEVRVSDAVVEEGFERERKKKVKSKKLASVAGKKMVKRKKSKTKFDEYIEMEMERGDVLAENDLILEKKLAKKLKVKRGKLGGDDDDLSLLLEGIPSAFDMLVGEEPVEDCYEDASLSDEGVSDEDASLSDEGVLDEDASLSDEGVSDEDASLSDGGVSDEEVQHEMEAFSSEEDDDSDMPHSSSEECDRAQEVVAPVASKREKKRTRKTNFEEYLDMEGMQKGDFAASEDIEMETKLAKKLKIKQGKLKSNDDDMNNLFVGIPSVLDSVDNPRMQDTDNLDSGSLSKKSKIMNHAEQEQTGRTLEQVRNDGSDVGKERDPKVAPALGSNTKYVAPHLRSLVKNESEEHAKIRRRLRGLLNRLSETNVESITGEISTIFHAVGRSAGSDIISQEVLASCAGGPRGNEQYAATFAAFVAGMACLVGIDFGAKVLASLAQCFEKEYLREDNLSLRNLVLLLSYLYIFGVCTSELAYDFMTMLSKRLTEVDVSTILTILQTCGMRLRGDDPVGMKNFIQSVQLRVNELKASSGDGQTNLSGKRMEFMLETICEIKNNKKRPKEETVQHSRIKKWLQKLRVEDILVRVTKWSKLLDPDKKGQWWLSGDISSTEKVDEVANKIDWDVNEAQKMLELAAAQRMNTDARRAIFCVIMSGEDFRDAFAKLISLDLHGKQDREIMRVLMECCLQEKVFNKYYTVLGSKLCKHNKNHKFTLQYCLWDHYKELEKMPLFRSMHLAKFTAEMIASYSLSLAALKVVDFTDPMQLTPKRIMHFRMLFEAIFDLPDKIVWNAFSRVAVTPEYESLRIGIKFFISKYVISSQNSLEKKFKIVKKALKNAEGQLM